MLLNTLGGMACDAYIKNTNDKKQSVKGLLFAEVSVKENPGQDSEYGYINLPECRCFQYIWKQDV